MKSALNQLLELGIFSCFPTIYPCLSPIVKKMDRMHVLQITVGVLQLSKNVMEILIAEIKVTKKDASIMPFYNWTT